MSMSLFAGVPVTDHAAALPWYERLFGREPSFFPHDTEAVWVLTDHGSVYIVQQPERAGHAVHTIIVGDLDSLVEELARRGLEPTRTETYPTGARKTIYIDPDGNEIGFGSVPD